MQSAHPQFSWSKYLSWPETLSSQSARHLGSEHLTHPVIENYSSHQCQLVALISHQWALFLTALALPICYYPRPTSEHRWRKFNDVAFARSTSCEPTSKCVCCHEGSSCGSFTTADSCFEFATRRAHDQKRQS